MRKKVLISLSGFTIFLFCLSASTIVRGNSNYVGSEVCKDCHEDYCKGFIRSIHAKKAVPGAPINSSQSEFLLIQ